MTQKTDSKKMTFRTNLIITFTTIIVAALFLITFLNYYQSSETVMQLNDGLIASNTEQIILKTNHFLSAAEVSSKVLSRSITDKEYFTTKEKSLEEMWKFLLVHKQLAFIYIADEKGRFVQVRRTPRYATKLIHNVTPSEKMEIIHNRDSSYTLLDSSSKENNYDPRVRPWYKNTTSAPKAHWSDMYIFSSTGKPGITVTYPLIDKESDEQFGVMAADITLETLSQFLKKQNDKNNSISFIVNEKDQLIAFPTPELAILKENNKVRAVLVSELSNSSGNSDIYSDRLLNGIKKAYKKHKESGEDRVFIKEKSTKYIGVFKQFPEN